MLLILLIENTHGGKAWVWSGLRGSDPVFAIAIEMLPIPPLNSFNPLPALNHQQTALPATLPGLIKGLGICAAYMGPLATEIFSHNGGLMA